MTWGSWTYLNDDNEGTFCAVDCANPLSHMELDLGEGGKMIDKVRMVIRDGYQHRQNGVILYVMGNERNIIFQYTLVSPVSNIFEFTIPS